VCPVELALGRSAALAKRGLQRLNSLEQADRHFEDGVRRYTNHEYSAAAECFRCALTFNAADIQAHVMLGSSLIDPLVASGEFEATVVERPEIIEEAFAHFHIAAKAGDGDAQGFVAYMYRDGDGVARDDALAFFWMHKAARHGRPCIQRQVGLMYEHGRGVERNLEQAAYWYGLVAEQNGYFERSEMTDLQRSIAGHSGGYRRPT
jgi:TPR repeat protein